MTEIRLFSILIDNDWLDVKGMPHVIPDVLVDIVFITAGGSVELAGVSHTLRDSWPEAFSLTIREHAKEFLWKEDESGQTKRPPRRLSDEWAGQPIAAMLKTPRDVRFYSDPELAERTFPAKKLLDNCTAMEFIKDLPGCVPLRFVLRASNTNPCCVEVATTDEGCDRLLKGLVETKLESNSLPSK